MISVSLCIRFRQEASGRYEAGDPDWSRMAPVERVANPTTALPRKRMSKKMKKLMTVLALLALCAVPTIADTGSPTASDSCAVTVTVPIFTYCFYSPLAPNPDPPTLSIAFDPVTLLGSGTSTSARFKLGTNGSTISVTPSISPIPSVGTWTPGTAPFTLTAPVYVPGSELQLTWNISVSNYPLSAGTATPSVGMLLTVTGS